jgi:hypothetical protein
MSRTLWRFLDRDLLSSEHIEAKVMEFLRKGVLTKRQTVNGQQQELVTTELNPNNRLVQEALPGYGGVRVEHDDEGDEDDDDQPDDRGGELVESFASPNGTSRDTYADGLYEDEDPLDNIGNLINPPPRR